MIKTPDRMGAESPSGRQRKWPMWRDEQLWFRKHGQIAPYYGSKMIQASEEVIIHPFLLV
jgi:hypothetical protein